MWRGAKFIYMLSSSKWTSDIETKVSYAFSWLDNNITDLYSKILYFLVLWCYHLFISLSSYTFFFFARLSLEQYLLIFRQVILNCKLHEFNPVDCFFLFMLIHFAFFSLHVMRNCLLIDTVCLLWFQFTE